jgi:hypothetical protein
MKPSRKWITAVIVAISGMLTGLAMAQTTFIGGNIQTSTNWSNGLPASGNDGTSATNGTGGGDFNGWLGATVNVTGGLLEWGSTRFAPEGGTWNISGGEIDSKLFWFEGTTEVNISGGKLTLNNIGGTIGPWSSTNASMSVSGSAIIDGAIGTAAKNSRVLTTGPIDIQSDWTGFWTMGAYVDTTKWLDHFTSGQIMLDGNTLDAARFAVKFAVTDDGQTLSLKPPSGTLIVVR